MTQPLGTSENPDGVDLKTIYTLANLVSLIRLLLVPLFLYLLLAKHDNAALVVFSLAAGTDWLDGQIARRTATVSELGRLMDPAIDRILVASGIIGLYLVGRVPFWCVLVLLLRDMIMLYGAWLLEKTAHVQIRVKFLGKVTTAVLFVAFVNLLFGFPKVSGLGWFSSELFPGFGNQSVILGIWLLYIGIMLSAISAVFYIKDAIRAMKSHNLL